MWGEKLEVSPEGVMVRGWVEQAWTVWKGRNGVIFSSNLAAAHTAARMTDVLGKSINNATGTHQSGGRVTSAFWRLNRMKRFVTVWLSIEVSFTAQTKNSRKDPRHRHWSLCITAVMMFIQSDTCFGILLNFLNYFYYTSVEQLI